MFVCKKKKKKKEKIEKQKREKRKEKRTKDETAWDRADDERRHAFVASQIEGLPLFQTRTRAVCTHKKMLYEKTAGAMAVKARTGRAQVQYNEQVAELSGLEGGPEGRRPTAATVESPAARGTSRVPALDESSVVTGTSRVPALDESSVVTGGKALKTGMVLARAKLPFANGAAQAMRDRQNAMLSKVGPQRVQ